MIVGGYALDLYCDAVRHDDLPLDLRHRLHPASFNAETGAACRAAARRAGWTLNQREGTAICPYCSGRRAVPNCP